jgi:D-sedoheptulose 7-phosphate isomerase
MTSLFQTNLDEHLGLFTSLGNLATIVEQSAQKIAQSLETGSKLMLCGNGGSAAMALSTDSSALTCISNDYSFDEVFSRQVQGLGRAGDCLLAISTSGNSVNIIRAVEMARTLGIYTIGLLGRDGGHLKSLCDLSIVVESPTTARIQEAHIFIGHIICGAVEQALGLAPPDEGQV